LLVDQVLAGGGLAVVTGLVAAESEDGLVVAAIGPLAVGVAVCAIGNASDLYQGSYVTTVLGAYLGAFTALPLFVAGAREKGDTTDYSASYVLAGVGWFVIQPAMAVVAWHAGRHRRGAPRPPAVVVPLDVRLRSGGSSRLPGELTVPVVALSF
jgi:hypothetical protein